MRVAKMIEDFCISQKQAFEGLVGALIMIILVTLWSYWYNVRRGNKDD